MCIRICVYYVFNCVATNSVLRLFNVTWVGAAAWRGHPQNAALVKYT